MRKDKFIPEMFKILSVKLIVLFIMVPLELIVLGPIGSYLGVYIAEGVKFLYTAGGFMGTFVLEHYLYLTIEQIILYI